MLAYRFNSFNFAIATIFSKSSVILLITLFTTLFCTFFHEILTYQFISPKNLKRSKLGLFGLHEKF